MKDRLNEIKTRSGITTEDLSSKSGVPIGTINKILNGETSNPRLSTAKALARALGCTLDNLMSDDDLHESSPSNQYFSPVCKKIEDACKRLNDQGQEKVLHYALDIFEIEKYRKDFMNADCAVQTA